MRLFSLLFSLPTDRSFQLENTIGASEIFSYLLSSTADIRRIARAGSVHPAQRKRIVARGIIHDHQTSACIRYHRGVAMQNLNFFFFSIAANKIPLLANTACRAPGQRFRGGPRGSAQKVYSTTHRTTALPNQGRNARTRAIIVNKRGLKWRPIVVQYGARTAVVQNLFFQLVPEP